MTEKERLAIETLREFLRRKAGRSLDSLDFMDEWDLLECVRLAGFEFRK